MNNPITVLLVDDHKLVRQGVRAFLEAHDEFLVVGEAESGKSAVELAEETVPDVVLMDLIMPEMDGVEATRQVKNVSPRSQIVVLTSYHEDEHIFPALEAGATSYILKDVDMDELADAIERAARGEVILHPSVASRVLQELHGAKKDEVNPFTELTKREMEVLKLIASLEEDDDVSRGFENLLIGELRKRELDGKLRAIEVGEDELRAEYQASQAAFTRPGKVRMAMLHRKGCRCHLRRWLDRATDSVGPGSSGRRRGHRQIRRAADRSFGA